MKIFTTQALRQIDAYTIEHEPIASIDLMEQAAQALTQALCQRWSDPETPFTLFAGPGNNGGDALAVARLLAGRGYRRVCTYLFNPKEQLSADCQTNMERLAQVPGVDFHIVTTQFTPPTLTADHVVVDGLFGNGLNKPLNGGFAAMVRYINASPAYVVSIDLPSGLMGEDNTYNIGAHIVKADLTLTIQAPKLAFLFAENAPYVGEWHTLDIGLSEEALEETYTDYALLDVDDVTALIRPRHKFDHKGKYGHALLIAGSLGMAGASVLAARGCLRSGVGLLTVHVPFGNNSIVQTAVPEAMTQLDISERCFAIAPDTDDYQAIGIGPGLGRSAETEAAFFELLATCQTPMVIDADGLNLLGEHRSYLTRIPKGSILTPHPKELERLTGKCQNSYERLMKARELSHQTGAHIILKGAYSAVIAPDGQCTFNPTGNPGMAKGGSGDVLTGVVLALLAQGYAAGQAARLAACVHGLAGDIAAKKCGVIGMTADDIAACLPMAWKMMAEEGERR